MNQDRAMFRFRFHFAALAFAMTSAACSGAVTPTDTASDVNSTSSLSKETDGGTAKNGKVSRSERARAAMGEQPRRVKGANQRDDADELGETPEAERKVKRGGIGRHPGHAPPPRGHDEPGPPPDDANDPGAPPPPGDGPHGDGAPPTRGPAGKPVLVHGTGEPANELDDDDCDDVPQPPTSSDCEDDERAWSPNAEGSSKTPH